jgi:N-acylneuraminate cytidylyltransferase/CMP-N,N'-diacetyllegionaminic acid synthase
MKMLALIAARGGSKRIPNKNLASLAGRPMIAYTIQAALESHSVDRLVVSTDDRQIAEVARSLGAEAPFMRPAALASDNASSVSVVLHALDQLALDNYSPDSVMLLQPTSPLRTALDIDRAADLLRSKNADAVVSVCSAVPHPYWTKRLDQNGCVSEFIPQQAPASRSQDLPPAYALNGAIYLSRREILVKTQSFYGGKTCAYIMPAWRSSDIDSYWDLHIADLLLRYPFDERQE